MTRVLHHVLDEAEAWNLRIRKSLIGVGSIFDFHKFRFIGVNITNLQQIVSIFELVLSYWVSKLMLFTRPTPKSLFAK